MKNSHLIIAMLSFALLSFLTPSCHSQEGDAASMAGKRARMVVNQLESRGISNSRVLGSFRKVERHRFVLPKDTMYAYEDCPLPIGEGQTISQPYIVAFMTQALHPDKKMKVLEIGTGSGYQAAILAELCGEVYSIEIIDILAKRAERTLEELGYKNVHVKTGDGYMGWNEFAPFDAIIVTCAPTHVPQPLIDQLAEKGRIIIPVGASPYDQELVVLRKEGKKMKKEDSLPVRFVPMVKPNGSIY
jgi:protein-L-isoaspartate(D-aspartate) O-methyltransferase